ncbi:hypothetical protein FHG87_015293 [Trinorchestia longiramus]|nr:hypothetical protein FHG87_015293 [Trinorchestia longiramus]
MWYLMNLNLCHLRRSLLKKLSVFLGPSLKKKNMRIQKESWSSVVQLGTELLLINLENGCALHKINLMFLERSAYTKALLSRFDMDKANSVATPVDVNADLVTTSDEVEECDKDLCQSAFVLRKLISRIVLRMICLLIYLQRV